MGGPAGSLVLDIPDSNGNASPPDPDPGWNHVAQHLGGPSAVYLGCGWVLTTDHVGVTIVVIQGERYDPVPGSITPIINADRTPADLVLFRIDPEPNLPPLKIPISPLRLGQEVTMVGHGDSRGERLTVDFPEKGLVDGYFWQKDDIKRWGTNRVTGSPKRVTNNHTTTWAVPLVFDALEFGGATPEEAAAARGDSGGAVFAEMDPLFPERGSGLAGLLFSVTSFDTQPSSSSLYGNVSWAADLSRYRDQIAHVVWGSADPNAPEATQHATCEDAPEVDINAPVAKAQRIWIGLVAGGVIATVIGFGLRRRRRSKGARV